MLIMERRAALRNSEPYALIMVRSFLKKMLNEKRHMQHDYHSYKLKTYTDKTTILQRCKHKCHFLALTLTQTPSPLFFIPLR